MPSNPSTRPRPEDDVTAADLLSSPEFQAMCNAWEHDGRAFEGFADWFEERGEIGMAKAWRWAANTHREENYMREGGYICPWQSTPGKMWGWCFSNHPNVRSGLPFDTYPRQAGFAVLIAAFLLRAAEVYPDGIPA